MAESSESPEKAPAREPGAPFPKDAIDPELVRLGRAPTRVGPLLSLSILAFCVYMMASLWDDLEFSRAGAPEPVNDVSLLHGGGFEDDFVRVEAVPDRSFAGRVFVGQAGVGGHRVAPVLGTSDRVWLLTDGSEWTAEVAYDELRTGRVRPLDDLPLGEPLRAWVAEQPPVPRFVTAEAVRHAIEHDAALVATPAGGALPIAGDTAVTVARRLPARAELRALATDDRPDAATWALALRNAGLLPPDGRAFRETERAYWFDVPAPEGLDAIRAQLTRRQLFAVDVAPHTVDITTTWGALAATPGGLQAGGQVVPWPQVTGVAVAVAHTVPNDAVVLLTDEHPDVYWYVLPIYLALIFFGGLFGWALARSLRPAKATT